MQIQQGGSTRVEPGFFDLHGFFGTTRSFYGITCGTAGFFVAYLLVSLRFQSFPVNPLEAMPPAISTGLLASLFRDALFSGPWVRRDVPMDNIAHPHDNPYTPMTTRGYLGQGAFLLAFFGGLSAGDVLYGNSKIDMTPITVGVLILVMLVVVDDVLLYRRRDGYREVSQDTTRSENNERRTCLC